MSYEQNKTKCHEIETASYKAFMKVAKRIKNLQYGKWEIVPDVSDPLRKFYLEKKDAWFTLRLSLKMEEFCHRYNGSTYTTWENRYDYRAKLVVSGATASAVWTPAPNVTLTFVPLYTNTHMKLKPRMAKKLIALVDDTIIPKFYMIVLAEDQSYNAKHQANKVFDTNIASIPGLKITSSNNTYDRRVYGELSGCPVKPTLNQDNVTMELDMDYNTFRDMCKKMGWGI